MRELFELVSVALILLYVVIQAIQAIQTNQDCGQNSNTLIYYLIDLRYINIEGKDEITLIEKVVAKTQIGRNHKITLIEKVVSKTQILVHWWKA